MKLLAIETATESCTAALLIGSEVRERYEVVSREHARMILPMVESLLLEAGIAVSDLDGIAMGRGPGSFTGVRIAAGVVQGIAFGGGLSVVPVSTLAVMAQGVYRESGARNILPAIDARMSEIYCGCYRVAGSLVEAACEDAVVPPDSANVPFPGPWTGAGTGWAVYANELEKSVGTELSANLGEYFPHARDLAVLGADLLQRGQSVTPEFARPVYLRDKVAVKP